MKFIADFHIHSHYSRATSKNLIPEYLDFWARLKGLSIIGSGDFTHPGWTAELKEKLEPAEDGLFKLKNVYKKNEDLQTPFLPGKEVRFMLTAEISNIYKKNNRVRKVHNVVFAPDFQAVDRIQQKLTAIGANITSDGRPILGLDSRDLLEMMLEADENIFFVPAHIWTPWFSVLGSKSGFDTIEECYGDLAGHVHAVETGLSTDPPMNWMCGFLDNYTLIANSDAHSPEKLGRNANRFDSELSYPAITDAMKTGDPRRFLGSIDLFPQEGKYHYDGHRKCDICWDPVQTLKHDGICPKCGKPVTVGVMNRVVQLSDREELSLRPNRHPFVSIIPLKEMMGELAGVGPNSKKVDLSYMSIIKKGVTELELLLDAALEDIERYGGPELAEAVRRMRSREIFIQEGFDGQYGVIKVLAEHEIKAPAPGSLLFEDLAKQERTLPPRRKIINFNLEEFQRLRKEKEQRLQVDEKKETQTVAALNGLNPLQQDAVEHFTGPALVIAGPGTGKTRVLTQRIMYLIENKGVEPAQILAVTFTNKAAAEIGERLNALLANKSVDARPTITTFHGLGYSILKEWHENEKNMFSILDPEEKIHILRQAAGCDRKQAAAAAHAIETAKQQMKTPDLLDDPGCASAFRCYDDYLRAQNTYDLDDLIYVPVTLLKQNADMRGMYRKRHAWILIDEYQDINYAQYQLVRALAPSSENGSPANLCVIGDPDQAIYGFRGADVGFIRRFQDDYPGAAVYRLQQSYRCSDAILKASGDVMQRGESGETLLSGMETGVKIKIVKNDSHKSEAEFVARTIEQMMGGLRFFSMDSSISEGQGEAEIDSLSDFAVLCRTRSQMEAVEKAFSDHSIPYQAIGEEPFFKQEPIRSMIDVLKIARSPHNAILKERLTKKRIIAPGDIAKFQALSRDSNSAAEIIARLGETCFSHLLKGHEALFKRLLDWARDIGGDVDNFLRLSALGTAADTYLPALETVALMTLHAAKGLEFKAVFIVGCEEGLLPYSLFESRTADREEERRLLYVGMTRARKFLFLSHARKRMLRGREYELPRSSFLDCIERKLIELSRQERKKKEPTQRSLFDAG